MATNQPSWMNLRAVAAPIPEPAPVMRTARLGFSGWPFIEVDLITNRSGPLLVVERASFVRTARRIFEGGRVRAGGAFRLMRSTNRHFTANTQTAPPCGTSGYWPGKIRFMRVCIFAGSTPQPDCTAIYCLPSTWNDTGTAATPEPVGNSHSTLPVLASNARNMRSLVPPANSNPPPVARTGPQLNDGMLVVHAFLPVSRFQACSSPMWSAPATIFITFLATPMKRSPCTYFGASPVSWVQRLSLAGM